jgi:hypothetical protein
MDLYVSDYEHTEDAIAESSKIFKMMMKDFTASKQR